MMEVPGETTRTVHLVGSYPADDPLEAMRNMYEAVGSRLSTLPTGETDRSEMYVVPILGRLVNAGYLEVKKPGDWTSIKRRATYQIPPDKRLDDGVMTLGYREEAAKAWPVFYHLRQKHDRPDLALQVGMPTAFTLGCVALGLKQALRQHEAFSQAMLRDIRALRAMAGNGNQVVVQLEATAELVFMAKLQAVRGHAFANRAFGLARRITDLAGRSPAGTRFGVHLCLGSLHNIPGATMRTLAPLVSLANSIVHHWPKGRTLEFIHGPLAAGEIPPSADPAYYAPLGQLALGDVRFYAGLVNDTPKAAQQQALRMAEEALGHRLDGIASTCGLGRHERQLADTLLHRTATLATYPN
jgi:hypothetical protein